MKQCPRCQKTYNDDALNFCLDDGEVLTQMGGSSWQDDSPPTMVLDAARATNPTDWPSTPPPAPLWQQPQGQAVPFGSSFVAKRDQTLPLIAMILGILSLPLICCYGGFWLGLPAAVLGFLGMRNADRDDQRYGGRGMAIAGLVLGAVSFLASIVVAIAAIISSVK